MSERTILQFPKALESTEVYSHRTTEHGRRQFWVLGAFTERCEKLVLALSRRPVGVNIRMESTQNLYDGFLSKYTSRIFIQICRTVLIFC